MSSFEVKYPSTVMMSRLDINTDVVKEQQLPADFTEEEIRLLDTKYSYDHDPYHHLINPICFTDRALESRWNSHDYPLVIIREAYFKLRKEKIDGILQVLAVKVARHNLFHFAATLRRMKEYSVRLRVIRDSLLQKIPNAATTEKKRDKNRKRERTEGRESVIAKRTKNGSEHLSNNMYYHILVILKEILSILLVNDQSEVYEGNQRFVNGNFVNIPFSELMGLVEAGMRQLKSEMKREYSSYVKLIRFVNGAFAPTTEEYKVGMACEKQHRELSNELSSHFSHSVCWFSDTDEEIKVVFRDLIEVVKEVRYFFWR